MLVDVFVTQVEQSDIGEQNCGCGNGAGAVMVEDGGVEVRQLAEKERTVAPLDVVGLGLI